MRIEIIVTRECVMQAAERFPLWDGLLRSESFARLVSEVKGCALIGAAADVGAVGREALEDVGLALCDVDLGWDPILSGSLSGTPVVRLPPVLGEVPWGRETPRYGLVCIDRMPRPATPFDMLFEAMERPVRALEVGELEELRTSITNAAWVFSMTNSIAWNLALREACRKLGLPFGRADGARDDEGLPGLVELASRPIDGPERLREGMRYLNEVGIGQWEGVKGKPAEADWCLLSVSEAIDFLRAELQRY